MVAGSRHNSTSKISAWSECAKRAAIVDFRATSAKTKYSDNGQQYKGEVSHDAVWIIVEEQIPRPLALLLDCVVHGVRHPIVGWDDSFEIL